MKKEYQRYRQIPSRPIRPEASPEKKKPGKNQNKQRDLPKGEPIRDTNFVRKEVRRKSKIAKIWNKILSLLTGRRR